MEDSSKCEDGESSNTTPACPQVNQTPSDTKSSIDNKNTQARVVRGTKKLKLDNNDPANIEKKDVKDEEATEAKVKSLKRSCELWSMEDKETFFKALNEYGKDFDALQSYFLSQGKKRGLSDAVIKNKEQIRHFYYRTWLKISKCLKFSEDVKKTTQELYGLINYGELRRKLPRIHEKIYLKLNELIYWGSTQVRLRGKTMRIKTPICRALRKLNQLEDWQEEIKLPSRITIELRPRNNQAWWKVQSVSMNPRVRTLLPIQRRLSNLLIFLQQRWRLTKYTTCSTVENLVASLDDVKDTRLLRVAPPEGCKIAMPMVNLGEYLTSNSVSLNSYEKRLGLKSSRIDLLGSVQHLKGVGKKGIKRSKSDKKILNRPDENSTLPDVSSDVDLLETGNSISEKPAVINNMEKPSSEHHSEPNRFPGRETVERIRRGWNVEEANTITVGDLFLMFGRESKITLEYWWEWLPNEQYTTDSSSTVHDDNSMLQKLLSLAKHNYGTNKVYDNTSGSSETVISSRVPSVKEATFRRPLIPYADIQAYHKLDTTDAFKTQLDKFKSRFSKRGRTVRQKSLVIQRVLPIIPAPSTTISDMPTEDLTDENKIGEPSLCQTQTDKIIAVSANEAQDKTFLDALEANGDAKNSNSIITSATQILKEGEHQWLNSEVADFSLSSFLGSLESPVKGSQRSQAGEQIMEDVRPPSDVNTDVVSHMQCLMGENSVDYMVKFANLASQIASDENKK